MLKSIKSWSDSDIIDGIKNNQNVALEKLYRLDRDGIIHHVINNSGNYDDAADVIQNGVVAVWNNIKTGKYTQQDNTQLKTYFNRICKNLWYKELRKRSVLTTMPDDFGTEDAVAVDYSEQEKMLADCFAALRNKCQSVLKLRFWDNKKIDEIADLLGNSANVIKNHSSSCLSALRDCVNQKK